MHKEEIKKCLDDYLKYPTNKVMNVEKLFIAICNYIFSIEEIVKDVPIPVRDLFNIDLRQAVDAGPIMQDITSIQEDFIFLKQFEEDYSFCSGCQVSVLLRRNPTLYEGCYKRREDGNWLVKPLNFIHRVALVHDKAAFKKRAINYLKLRNIKVTDEEKALFSSSNGV